MNEQTYIETLLKKSAIYTLTNPDKEKIQLEGLSAFVLSKLFSKKFRKWKLDDSCKQRVTFAVHERIKSKKPITVIYPQGGYKLWRFSSSPEADFAEFFNISYVLEYLAPIAASYKPGVELIYYMHTLLMEKHDNLTTEEIQAYVDSFEKLLVEFRKYVPKNMTIKILRDADIYERDEYFIALEKGKVQAEEDMKAWTKEKQADFARMANLNIKWKGREDWTILSQKEKEEKIHQAALYEQSAVNNLPKVMDTIKAPDIVLLFTKSAPIFIGIGSTHTSIAKYWVGFGILEEDNGVFYPRILTPSQYEYVKTLPLDTVQIEGITALKNLQTLLVHHGRLSFMKKK